jgi:RNA-directed DNA polymerase
MLFLLVFDSVYSALTDSIRRWARRRHLDKSRRWIADKYFSRTGLRNWRFFGEAEEECGQPVRNWISLTASTPIRRHLKVRQDANHVDDPHSSGEIVGDRIRQRREPEPIRLVPNVNPRCVHREDATGEGVGASGRVDVLVR